MQWRNKLKYVEVADHKCDLSGHNQYAFALYGGQNPIEIDILASRMNDLFY